MVDIKTIPLLRRYGAVALGQMMAAGGQFVVMLGLLHTLSPSDFGALAFVTLAGQFSLSIVSALLCGPYPVALAERRESKDLVLAAFHAVGLVLAVGSVAAFYFLGVLLGLAPLTASILAAYVALLQFRWFARAHFFAIGRVSTVVASDCLYGTVLLCGGSAFLVPGWSSLLGGASVLAIASVIGILAFGPAHLTRQFRVPARRNLSAYLPVWLRHARWSLAGVLSTEATGNAHAYIVTLLLGPAAFAPLAAATLFIRPIGIASNALSDMDRPVLAKQIAGGKNADADALAHRLLVMLGAVWIVCVAALALLLVWFPHFVAPQGYAPSEIQLALVFWFAIAGVRSVRTPPSLMLQASGQFRPLANASLLASLVSIAGVLVALSWLEAAWTLAGILLGEVLFAALTFKANAERPTFRPIEHACTETPA